VPISEAELIEGCKANKRDLQKALYQRYSAKMFMICLRYTKNREEAEDILQDGFVKLFGNIRQFNGAGSFEGWIRRIMVNTALEAIRKRKLEYAPDDISNLTNVHANESDALSKIALQDLLALIQELPTGCQLIFNLYVIEGFNHKEIAEKLGVSEGTSKSQLARARQLLQEKLKGNYAIKELVK
jgi:RNA polymerase sigma factor (sigma-70 family)